MDSDEVPPPPYSAVDPLLGQASNNRNAASLAEANRNLLHLRGGDAPLPGSGSVSSESVAESLELPAHFTSAAAYFVERPPPAVEHGQQTLDHHMTIYPRSQSKDFPRRPRCWSSRMEDISQQDWDMFMRLLFPPQLGLASSSAQLPRQVRAEIQRDRKDRPQETDEQRDRRIRAVMMEWNQYFFEPRAARIVFVYVTDPRNGPVSPLCPRCYPAATKASQENRTHQTPEASQLNTAPTATTGQSTSTTYPPNAQPSYGFPNPNAGPAPYPPYGPSPFYHPGHPPHGYHYPSPYQAWGSGWGGPQWGNQYDNWSNKGGPLGWISALATQAQKYGERISEQAQQYGDQISAHASHYGRQVEEQAMAHGRWIEEQAAFGGRKVDNNNTFTGWHATPGQAYYQNTAAFPHPSASSANQPALPAPTQRARRDSVASNSSESSLSSIDSLSTTSELSSSDLATVRAQLLSLNDQHDRDLYEAAVELRRQLDALRDSRRQARFSGRGHWRPGMGHQAQNSLHGRSSWGRWESPQDRRRNQAEKRAAKEEMRATRKAFREIFRRARDEQREQRRAKRNRRRQGRRSRKKQREEPQAPKTAASLEQSLQNLTLDDRRASRTAIHSSTSVTSPVPSTTTVLSSPVNSVSTLSITSSQGNDVKENTENHQK